MQVEICDSWNSANKIPFMCLINCIKPSILRNEIKQRNENVLILYSVLIWTLGRLRCLVKWRLKQGYFFSTNLKIKRQIVSYSTNGGWRITPRRPKVVSGGILRSSSGYRDNYLAGLQRHSSSHYNSCSVADSWRPSIFDELLASPVKLLWKKGPPLCEKCLIILYQQP